MTFPAQSFVCENWLDSTIAILLIVSSPLPVFVRAAAWVGGGQFLPVLHEKYPDDELSFIAGGDSLVRSPWYRLAEVLTMLESFIIAPRGEVPQMELDDALAELPRKLRDKVIVIDIPRVTESATLVRTRLGEGKSPRYLIPEPVFRYIERHGLYRAPIETRP